MIFRTLKLQLLKVYGWQSVSRLHSCHTLCHYIPPLKRADLNTVETGGENQVFRHQEIRLNKIYFPYVENYSLSLVLFLSSFVKENRNYYSSWFSFPCQQFGNSQGPRRAVKKQKNINLFEVIYQYSVTGFALKRNYFTLTPWNITVLHVNIIY